MAKKKGTARRIRNLASCSGGSQKVVLAWDKTVRYHMRSICGQQTG